MDPAPRNHDSAPHSLPRDDILRARVAGTAGMPDFRDTASVVGAARRFLRHGDTDRALRLLAMAIGARPADEGLWIARLEVIALTGTQVRFLRAMREFLDVHPDPSRLHDVVHLWKRVSPG